MADPRPMPATIDTERLLLRPWRDDDAEPLRRLWGERDVRARRRIDARGHPTVAELRQQLVDARHEAARTGFALLAIERRERPGFVGYCGLVTGQATEAEPELAYELLRRWHGRGFATEAARAVVAAADAAGRPRLWSTIRAWNAPSLGVIAKAGFSPSGRVDRDPDRGDSIWFVRDRPR